MILGITGSACPPVDMIILFWLIDETEKYGQRNQSVILWHDNRENVVTT